MIGHLYTLLFVSAQTPAVTRGGGVVAKRRTVQPSNGMLFENPAAIARAKKRRRNQQFLTAFLMTQ